MIILLLILGFVGIPLLMVGVVVLILRLIKQGEGQKQQFLAKAEQAGYQPISAPSLDLSSPRLAQDSFSYGFTGQLKSAGNQFTVQLLAQKREGGNNRVLSYSIVTVDIPDTQLQLYINSKINSAPQNAEGRVPYKNEQRVTLEGDFGTYFDLYMPEATQSESLSLLAPNSMWVILRDFADYDIKIDGDKLRVYTHEYLSFDEAQVLLDKLELLIRELWLRKDDARPERATNNLVARTATDASTDRRHLKRRQLLIPAGVICAVGIIVLWVLGVQTSFMVYFVLFFIVGMGATLAGMSALSRENRLKKQYQQTVARRQQDTSAQKLSA